MATRRSAPATAPADEPAQRTDRHLWPEVSTPDAPVESIHVTADGAIGINIDGEVIVRPLRQWHALAEACAALETQLNAWQSLGVDVASSLEQLAGERVSVTMTEHRAAELMREKNTALTQLAARIRQQVEGKPDG